MSHLNLSQLCDRLYELDETLKNVSSEELPPELAEAIDSLLQDRNIAHEEYYERLNTVLNLIKSKTQWAAIRKQRIAELRRLVEIDENIAKRVNIYLLKHLEQVDLTKFRTTDFNVTVATNGGKTPVIISEDVDVESIPQHLVKIEKKISKEAVRESLEQGEVLGFAAFGERGKHLKIS